MGIAGFIVVMTIMATFIYFTRLQLVAALGDDLDLRTTWFARIDLITQVTTLVLQAVVAGHLMKRFRRAHRADAAAADGGTRFPWARDRRVARRPHRFRGRVPRGPARADTAGAGDAVHGGEP
jgi:hypothetical protein